jgi:SSS family solute:Na+ symporter
MIGGLRGVVYTEVVQTVVLVVGAVLVLLFGLHEVGGVNEFKAKLPESFFHMIRPASDPVVLLLLQAR